MKPTPACCMGRMIAGLLTVAVMAACGSAAPAPAGPSPGSASHEHGAPGAAGSVRAGGTRLPHTAADVHFMSAMIGHHAQAIVMGRMAATHGASASVRTLAERIINAQEDEIATMQGWLRDRGQPVPEAHAGGMGSAMHGTQHHGGHGAMPGMLSEAQLKQLDQARGREFDRLFLTFMIQHHRGAVAMVKELFGSPGAGQDDIVFKFAADVNVDQTTEIARMERMLVALVLEGQESR